MKLHWGELRLFIDLLFWTDELIDMIVLAIILLRELFMEKQSIINYRWVLFEITLNCLQFFNLYLGIYNTYTSSFYILLSLDFIYYSLPEILLFLSLLFWN